MVSTMLDEANWSEKTNENRYKHKNARVMLLITGSRYIKEGFKEKQSRTQNN